MEIPQQIEETTPTDQLVIIAQLRRRLMDLMRIDSHKVIKPPDEAISFRGQVQGDTKTAFDQMTERFASYGYTASLQSQADGGHEVIAIKGVIDHRPGGRWLNVILFLITLFSVLYIGAAYGMSDAGLTIENLDSASALTEPLKYLHLGLPFAGTLLGILLAHELSHYFVARRYGSPVSLPYFVPMPLPPMGTMGAVIVQRAPMRNRQAVFDIGVAGPLGGLVVAIPLLILGLSLSSVQPPPPDVQEVLQEGNSLLYLGIKFLMFGKILPSNGEDVWLHSVAFAAWAGLLVTMINLIPVGQLDGGHVSYALLGRRSQILGHLVILAMLGWGGWNLINGNQAGGFWLLWSFLNMVMNQRHPPPLDDVTKLGGKRIVLGLAVLAIFILTFTPIPLQAVQLG
ncbi:MAG TPA: site-2 protease family protein [Chloroflexi bacterium]|nr:site-2 protease family protein [Chloroflexota bacterium]